MSAYVLGIDLGTTNSALASTPATNLDDPKAKPVISVTSIPQITQPGEVGTQLLLPSFLYLPGPGELPTGSLALPWDAARDYAVGAFARSMGAKVPGRLVSSAKSWLSHAGVDRKAAILPWQPPGAPTAVTNRKVSPVEATTMYLQHLHEAWNASPEGKQNKLQDQEIVLTVPASFDAIARQLTVDAATTAGLTKLTLLEEPQAAFYSWIEAHPADWRKLVKVGDVVLVCDVGGGTTDFSLIAVTEEAGRLALNRMAVGDHILLGGDNMDLALAHHLRDKLTAAGTKLDSTQLIALSHASRAAKEHLFANPKEKASKVTVLGRGSKLVGGTVATELTRDDLKQVILEGFFPLVGPDAEPRRAVAFGLQEIGLPYTADPVVSKHLAQFLHRNAAALKEHYKKAGQPERALPSAVLCNGGVFKASALQDRLIELLNAWAKAAKAPAIRLLEGTDLDLAVARGAAYFALAQKGKGVRIRGGLAMTYYVGIESAMPAVPGRPPSIRALCVAPMGMEEGTTDAVPNLEFGLVVGHPVKFRFLASNSRRDPIGTLVDDWETEIHELSPVETQLNAEAKADQPAAGTSVPVKLETTVTPIGTLDLHCVSRDGKQRWKLEFNVREGAS
jgi:molecular chaperone DnaK (HSP70)